ncbi:GTP-binding protein [Rhodobacteraceae bacterium RKSG542]|uniref:CobW family GTP-binding protein n=1 Tax=Pseudovibrio flavus TaxID=2529854 RepID=UPI0012BBD9D9|nr:GTP-binding protein [Pseudovibrio flavus]MTI18446.1 GTP-binding protein [Pseudovibrio flavus]
MSEIERPTTPPTPIPLTVITGFLGSGKTTLLNRLLKDPTLENSAVIINEFGEVGLDHLLVDSIEDGIIELSSGCLCCTIRGDLINTLEDLLRRMDNGRMKKVDRVIIETTGLADPAPVLHSVMLHPYLVMRYRLDGVITLFDAVNGPSTLDEHEEGVKQVAVADRVILTKTDLLEGEQGKQMLEAAIASVRRLNPGAELLDVQQGDVTAASIVNCGLYNPDTKIPEVSKWLKEEAFRDYHHHHGHNHGHSHEHGHGHTHDHGHHHHDINRHSDKVRAFSLTTERAISETVLEMFLDLLRSTQGPKLLRVKGIIKTESDPERPLVIHGVQHVFHPPARLAGWPDDDRRTRIVFITNGLPEGYVKRMFDAFVGEVGFDTPDRDAMMNNPLSVSGFSGSFK